MQIEINRELTEAVRTQVKAREMANGEINPIVDSSEIEDFCCRAIKTALAKGGRASEELHDGSDSNENKVKVRRVVDPLSVGEVHKILEAASIKHRDHLILRLFAKVGLHPGELYGVYNNALGKWEDGLQKENIDFSNKKLHVYAIRRKKKRMREIPMDDDVAINLLKNLTKDMSPGEYIFRSVVSYGTIQKLPNRYARRAGIKKRVSPRSLHNFFVMNLLKREEDISEVQRRLGFSTEKYTLTTIKKLSDTNLCTT